eukprot:GEZU01038851.1.p1 GENE.GEZU01038851.1~~GEZU01038851.1.p1  ORF type:complete len:289 (-),score=117.09 GEZU01038851.1:217-1083(-)
MSEKKTIVVLGATGSQGGAVARALLRTNKFHVKAVTRDPTKPAAEELRKLGAEVVKGDMNDKQRLVEIFRGAWGVFSVQQFWELLSKEKEIEQGCRVIDAAKESGVQFFLYSSVEGAERNSGIPHFDSKGEIEKYLQQQSKLTYAVLRPVFFMDNFTTSMWKEIQSGNVTVPMPPDRALQMVAVEDIGNFAALMFSNPEKYKGKAVPLAGDEITFPKAMQIISKYLGKEVKFTSQDVQEAMKYSKEWGLMFKWFIERGYQANINALRAEFPQLMDFDQWARKKIKSQQ